jgi:hypothetical protein
LAAYLRYCSRNIIKPFVPGGRKGKRSPRSDARRFFNTHLWIARSAKRSELP